jgi:hypothetical protein
MKKYCAYRNRIGELIVTLNGHPLNPRLDLWNHSPSGFECGYGGSGPAQLALAILANCLQDDERAVALHQEFKGKVIACLPRDGWTLTEKDVRAAVKHEWTQFMKTPHESKTHGGRV